MTGRTQHEPSPADGVDRRSQPRHITILRVGTIVANGTRELCLVRNISTGGLMAHVYSTMRMGQRVVVEVRNDEPICGTVTWIDESNVGISFDEEIDVAALLAPPAANGEKQPRMPRVQIDRFATLRVGARTYWVSIRDISQGGVKLEVDQPIAAGSQAVVTLDGFRPLPGAVRWVRNGLAGVSFNEVVPFRDLMRWLRGANPPA